MSEHKFTNALIRETSPYLLQHAHNPVQWYPWSQEALRRAREEDKPILLSIGYSACHWCHVMERESFENEGIAQIMNEHFINIKVDREERPDLDAIYMNAVQMMVGHGGWPMTVFLTPDQVPFYGGTYFPPEDHHGYPGFPRLLRRIAESYRTDKAHIRADAARIIQELQTTNAFFGRSTELSAASLDLAAHNLLQNFDSRNGGFGGAPKFPNAMALEFLLRSCLHTGAARYREAIDLTLEKMACGGIYDQLGGGFHRYSVDEHWLVPHFEKMLYDNALLSKLYLDAWRLTKKPLYRRIAQEILDYVIREMTSSEGGFFSTQDADSDGYEGKYFLWTHEEVRSLLKGEHAGLFCTYFDIFSEGNFEGKTILNIPRPAETVARLKKVPLEELEAVIACGRQLLSGARRQRIKPGRDEKILTAWNGLMLRSFAEASSVLHHAEYREVALRNADFILARLQRNGRLLRSYKDGDARVNAYQEDYALLIDGLISLYEATFNPRWIQESIRLAETMIDGFWDSQDDGFYFTSNEHESLIQRPKDFYDHATPSGNSAATRALLRLWKLTADNRWRKYAELVLSKMVVPMTNHPSAFGNLLCALDFLFSNPMEIAIVGDPSGAQTKMLLERIFERYLPNSVIACGLSHEPALLGARPQAGDQPTVYVCRDFTCDAPVTSVEDLADLLGKAMTKSGRP
jgi:uncharacterized protein YyaL (SSP411 family)